MTLQDHPCRDCKMPVIRAEQSNGLPLSCDLDPDLTGTWKLTPRAAGVPPLATKPSAKFAFGVKLYRTHACARIWSKKK